MEALTWRWAEVRAVLLHFFRRRFDFDLTTCEHGHGTEGSLSTLFLISAQCKVTLAHSGGQVFVFYAYSFFFFSYSVPAFFSCFSLSLYYLLVVL